MRKEKEKKRKKEKENERETTNTKISLLIFLLHRPPKPSPTPTHFSSYTPLPSTSPILFSGGKGSERGGKGRKKGGGKGGRTEINSSRARSLFFCFSAYCVGGEVVRRGVLFERRGGEKRGKEKGERREENKKPLLGQWV